MNILFFLTPKERVSYVLETDTFQKVLEKMEANGYTAVPLLSRTGKYIGTVTEGDLLWAIKDRGFPAGNRLGDIPITTVRRKRDNKPVFVQAAMEDMLQKVTNQNFVPVVDDDKVFIGIVTRKDVMLYLAGKCRKEKGGRDA